MKTSDVNSMEEEEDVQVEHVDVTQRDINITRSQNAGDTRDKLNLNIGYSLTKSLRHQNLTIEKLTEKFGTTNFLTALSSFLCHNLPGT